MVDSASTPPCRELVEEYASSIPGLTYLREDAPGLARARNRGREAARGDIVAFVDDDAAPTSPTGRAGSSSPSPTRASVASEARVIAFFPDCERPRWLSDRLLQFAGITRFETAREARSSAEWPFGANIAFRREALESRGRLPGAPRPERHFTAVGRGVGGDRGRARRRLANRPPPGRGRGPRRTRLALHLAVLLAATLVGRRDARPHAGRSRTDAGPPAGGGSAQTLPLRR